MKTANMTLNFKNDTAIIFGQPEKLIATKSVHYALPISPYSKILNNIVTGTNPDITLITISNKSKHDMIIKLQQLFSYPTQEKLLKLLNCADKPWNNDEELKHHIQKVSEECTICEVYRKPPPRPAVGLPLASSFQECEAMTSSFIIILLHLVDHTTRLSGTTVIPSKGPDTIIKAIFSCWIQISSLLTMVENLQIVNLLKCASQ